MGGYPFWFDEVPRGMSRKKYLQLEKKKPKHKTMKKWIQINKSKTKKNKKTPKKRKYSKRKKLINGGFSVKKLWEKAFKTSSLDENDYLNREEVLLSLQKIIHYDPYILIEYLLFYSLPKKQQNIIKKRYKQEGVDLNLYGHPDHNIQTNYWISLPYFLAVGEEKHPFKEYNFCGPGTKHELRLHPDYWPLYPLFTKLAGFNVKGTYPWNEPINHVDFCCSQHDMKYGLIGNTPEDIRIYDREMLYCVDNSYQLDKIPERVKNKLIRGTINKKITSEKIGLLKKGSFGVNLQPTLYSQDNFSSNQEQFIKELKHVLQNR